MSDFRRNQLESNPEEETEESASPELITDDDFESVSRKSSGAPKDNESARWENAVAMLDADESGKGGANGPSPFKIQPAPKVEVPKPPEPKPQVVPPVEQVQPKEQVKPKDVPEPLGGIVSDQAATSVSRALIALNGVVPGQPIPPKLREALDQAAKDAATISPEKAEAETKRLTEEVQSKDRKLPDGRVLPPWKPEQEVELWKKLNESQEALGKIPEPKRTQVSALLGEMERTPQTQMVQMQFLQKQLKDLADPKTPGGQEVATFLARQRDFQDFATKNQAGIMRRNLHQQEMTLLNAPALVSTIQAVALDRAGQPQDKAKIESLVKEALKNPFAVTTMPELQVLNDKYQVADKEMDDKVPGRAALRQALQILAETKGTAKERLEKARPFFEQALGASEQIDMKMTDDELKKVIEASLELDKNADGKKLDELDAKAVNLLENIKLPMFARLAYAKAINDAAVEQKDEALTQQALKVLQSIEKFDPGAKFDPLVQGAIKLVTEKKAFDLNQAAETGKPEVERLKKEALAKGQDPDKDLPFWRKGLNMGGELLLQAGLFMAATWVLGKMIRPVARGISGLRRSYETNRRAGAVEVDASLPAGEKPQLVHRDKEGKEKVVEGVRAEDGQLQLREGEKVEVAKMTGKDKLVLKVPKDANMTPDQVREAATKVLTPVTPDQAVFNLGQQFQSEVARQQQQIEALRQERDQAIEREGARQLRDSVPERVRKNVPTEFSPDVKDAMAQVYEANREKWPADYAAEYQKLMEAYEKGEPGAVERVNKLITSGGAEKATGTPAAPPTDRGPLPPSTPTPDRPTDTVRERPVTTEPYQTPELRETRPPGDVNRAAIDTLTTPDGMKYIESIPIGELTVARVQDKMDKIDAEIRAAKEKGLHDYAGELERLKREYEGKKPGAEREGYCKEVVGRMKEAHETAKGGKKGGLGVAGKAGTAVAVLMVGGWLLDVAAPDSITRPSGTRVLPTKR